MQQLKHIIFQNLLNEPRKSSDWFKEGHTTWIIFDNVHVWKLIHVYYFLVFPWLSKKLSQLPNLEFDSLLFGFYDSV